MEVLLLLVHGRTDRAIAAELEIGLRTAETHVASIMAKLGAESRVSAVISALRRGLIELPPEE
jgi:DNA-binding NarL/FixJ family response regulator